jgi:hypothetical protein
MYKMVFNPTRSWRDGMPNLLLHHGKKASWVANHAKNNPVRPNICQDKLKLIHTNATNATDSLKIITNLLNLPDTTNQLTKPKSHVRGVNEDPTEVQELKREIEVLALYLEIIISTIEKNT